MLREHRGSVGASSPAAVGSILGISVVAEIYQWHLEGGKLNNVDYLLVQVVKACTSKNYALRWVRNV